MNQSGVQVISVIRAHGFRIRCIF